MAPSSSLGGGRHRDRRAGGCRLRPPGGGATTGWHARTRPLVTAGASQDASAARAARRNARCRHHRSPPETTPLTSNRVGSGGSDDEQSTRDGGNGRRQHANRDSRRRREKITFTGCPAGTHQMAHYAGNDGVRWTADGAHILFTDNGEVWAATRMGPDCGGSRRPGARRSSRKRTLRPLPSVMRRRSTSHRMATRSATCRYPPHTCATESFDYGRGGAGSLTRHHLHCRGTRIAFLASRHRGPSGRGAGGGSAAPWLGRSGGAAGMVTGRTIPCRGWMAPRGRSQRAVSGAGRPRRERWGVVAGRHAVGLCAGSGQVGLHDRGGWRGRQRAPGPGWRIREPLPGTMRCDAVRHAHRELAGGVPRGDGASLADHRVQRGARSTCSPRAGARRPKQQRGGSATSRAACASACRRRTAVIRAARLPKARAIGGRLVNWGPLGERGGYALISSPLDTTSAATVSPRSPIGSGSAGPGPHATLWLDTRTTWWSQRSRRLGRSAETSQLWPQWLGGSYDDRLPQPVPNNCIGSTGWRGSKSIP